MLSAKKIGEKIREKREESHFTQEDLAGQVYVTRQAISSWEKGVTFPDIDNVVSLCEIFHCSLEELLCLREGGNDNEH
jgi:transcriptional regulator with XRE-family HTH domain